MYPPSLPAATESDAPVVVVNVVELLQRCMDNVALAERVLSRFVAEFPAGLGQLETLASEPESGESLRVIAHRWKGAAANIAAPQLAQSLALVEARAADGSREEIARLLAQVKLEFGRLQEHKSDWTSAAGQRGLEQGHVMDSNELSRVLVAEDDAVSREMLSACLTSFGYAVTAVENGQAAIEQIRSGEFRLVVSDWEMPELDGIELCRYVRSRHGGSYIYVILLTSRAGTQSTVEGLNAGADDFITKPFQPAELQMRLRTAERVLALEGRDLLIFSLAKLAESRDPETGAHLERIRQYSRLLAQHLATTEKYRDQVDGEFVHMVYLTSPLHDIGKVGIPDDVLRNPGRLSPEEFAIMQEHTVIGGQTLDAASDMQPEASFLKMGADIAWFHHEKYDGTGYPHGLAGDAIPLCARIVGLADVYDALTSKRVYKDAFSHEKSRDIILEGHGKHFDPDVVDAFLHQEDKFIETCQLLQPEPDEECLIS